MEIQKVTINNQTLTFVEIGQGKPTIVILGWLASLENFPFDIFNEFKETYFKTNKLIFLHLSNFGLSSLSTNPLSLNDYTNELDLFIKHFKYKKVNLIGHSAGGRHVLNYTTTFSTKINKLVLMSSAGFTPKIPKFKQLLKVNFYFHKFNALLPHQIKLLQDTYKNLYNSDLREKIKTIKNKTLILWGKQDTTITVDKADFFKKNIKNSRLIEYNNFDHMLTYNKEVWQDIFKFLQEKDK